MVTVQGRHHHDVLWEHKGGQGEVCKVGASEKTPPRTQGSWVLKESEALTTGDSHSTWRGQQLPRHAGVQGGGESPCV